MLAPDELEAVRLAPPREATALFSLIVCTLGRKGSLRRLFRSLDAQSLPDFEVIIVDQNPPGFLDEVVDLYRSQFRIVCVLAKPGLSSARNVGLAHAAGRVIAFPDDDCWYKPDTLSEVFARMKGDNAAAIVCGQ